MSDFDAWVPEDGSPDVAESHAGPDEARAGRSSQLRRWGMPVGLLGAGALIGGVVAASLSASAAPNPSPSPAAPAAPGAPGFGHGMPAPGQPGPGCRGP